MGMRDQDRNPYRNAEYPEHQREKPRGEQRLVAYDQRNACDPERNRRGDGPKRSVRRDPRWNQTDRSVQKLDLLDRERNVAQPEENHRAPAEACDPAPQGRRQSVRDHRSRDESELVEDVAPARVDPRLGDDVRHEGEGKDEVHDSQDDCAQGGRLADQQRGSADDLRDRRDDDERRSARQLPVRYQLIVQHEPRDAQRQRGDSKHVTANAVRTDPPHMAGTFDDGLPASSLPRFERTDVASRAPNGQLHRTPLRLRPLPTTLETEPRIRRRTLGGMGDPG